MRLLAILCCVIFSSSVFSAESISREQASVLVDHSMKERGVDLADFESPIITERGDEWAFQFKCKRKVTEDDCQFFASVQRGDGVVKIAASLSAPVEKIPEAIQEAILSQEIARGVNNLVVCVGVAGARASTELLHRLSESGTMVVDASECVEVMDTSKGSYHEPTKKAAIFFRIGHLEWIDGTHAMVGFQSYHDGLYAEGVTMSVELINGNWVVTERRSNWIS